MRYVRKITMNMIRAAKNEKSREYRLPALDAFSLAKMYQ